MIALLFDVLLAAGLLWLGWRGVSSPGLFESIVFFIVFGLLMALCWATLRAPDVALAEAAIGAGLTGALLLDAYRVFRNSDSRRAGVDVGLAAMAATVTVLLLVLLYWVLEPVNGLGSQVYDRLSETGVSNPVTAVLLNFRGYDTLLEVAVLLMALIGISALGTDRTDRRYSTAAAADQTALVDSLVHFVMPLGVVIAGYLLWTGTHAPGGAFQAGAVLAAIGVLLRLTEHLQPQTESRWLIRATAALGCGVFIAVGLGTVMVGGVLLDYPLEQATLLIVLIEATLMLSIGLTLTLLFVGSAGLQRRTS